MDNLRSLKSVGARSLKTRRRELGVEDPDRSPDLNLIEHLEDDLDGRLRARPHRYTSGVTDRSRP